MSDSSIKKTQAIAAQSPPAYSADRGERTSPSEELSLENIEEAMQYQQWGPLETKRGAQVREALTMAAKAILWNVQRSPLRTRALNAIVDARMLANAAITFRGRF